MGRKAKDITGKKFGRLTVIEPAPRPDGIKSHNQFWLCRCQCQKEVVVCGRSLRSGNTKSCGCLLKEQARESKTKHGMKGTRLYNIYKGMKQRCYNPNNKDYKDYGARGVKVCDEWIGENGFINFSKWAMTHGYSDDLTIDRINVDRGYFPDNCRWADYFTQANNRRPRSSTSGHTGVCKSPNGKYIAQIQKNGKMYRLGYFDTLEEAIEARERAEREFYPELFEEST